MFWMMWKRNAVVSPNSNMPFNASSAPQELPVSFQQQTRMAVRGHRAQPVENPQAVVWHSAEKEVSESPDSALEPVQTGGHNRCGPVIKTNITR